METADEEGIEIFTIEDLMEAGQLIPSVGQSLIVCSNPKKCASILQSNRKPLSKLGSKVILLSPKAIPRKTLEKFMKVGLTECVVEPVPPKTLLYKVKLLLRSISTRQEESDMEMKSIKNDESSQVSSNDRQRLEKGIISEESTDDLYHRELKKSEELQADYELNARSEKKAEEIDGHWSGSVEKTTKEEEKGNKKNDSSSVDHLESHYKGKLNSTQFEEEDDDLPKRKKQIEVEIDYDDFKEGTSDTLNFDIDDLKKKKKAQVSESTDNDNLTSDTAKEKIETHYKGKIGDFKIDEEEYGELTTGMDIDLDFSPENKKNKESELYEEDDDEARPRPKELDLDFDEAKKNRTESSPSDEEEERKKDKALDLDLSDDRDRNHSRPEETKTKKDPHTGDVDHIETMLKGHLDHRKDSEEEKEDYRDSSEDIDLDFEKSSNRQESNQQDDEDDFYEKNKVTLEFTDAPDYKKDKAEQAEESFYDRDSADSQNSAQAKERERETQSSDEEEDEHERKKNVQLEFADTKDRSKSARGDEEEDFLRTKKVGQEEKEMGPKRSPIDAHSEHIQTYYKSGEGIKHVDDNWDNKYERRPQEKEEKAASEDRVLQMLTKENLGEQTIDYKRLKEQFEAISMGSDGKLKMADVLITDSVSGKKSKGPRYYREDIVTQDSQASEEENTEDDESKNQIFVPAPAGLDFVIQMTNYYSDKELSEIDHFSKATEHIWNKFGAHCCFFIRRPEKSEYEIAHQKLIESTDPESAQAQFSIEQAMETRFDTWALMSLPYWLDHTFQSDKQVFFFPYTEGAQKIGFATVHFFHKIEEASSSEIEVILESVRGVYLQAFHKTGLEGNYNKEKKEGPKKQNLLSKMMFWKKAG